MLPLILTLPPPHILQTFYSSNAGADNLRNGIVSQNASVLSWMEVGPPLGFRVLSWMEVGLLQRE